MNRLIDAFEQFFDADGQPLSNGYLTFYENLTVILADTYSDTAGTTPNTNPVQLDGEGRLQNDIYGAMLYSVKLEDQFLNDIETRDNVSPRGGVSTGETIPNWDSTTQWKANNSLVLAGDGNYYIATQDNVNINPITDTNNEYWKQVEFKEHWSGFVTYNKWDVVIGSNNKQYQSLIDANSNNDPTIDSGANWEEYNTDLWSQGREYLAGEVRFDTNRWYKAVINNAGNQPSIDSGVNWLPAIGKVQKPTNTAPADAATGVSRTPTLTTSAFTVVGGSDTHEYSVYQLSKDSFTTVDYNILTNTDLVSHTVPTLLDGATEYSYRAKHKGVFAGLSDWSDVTTFTTTFPLDALYDSRLFTGTALARTEVTGINMSTASGAVLITNTSTTDPMRVVDTVRGVGNAISIGVDAFQASEPTGVTSFNADGYSLGVLAAYNGSGNSIFSINMGVGEGLFDIVAYGGTGVNRTVGHNLNSETGAVIALPRSGAAIGSTPWRFAWIRGMSSTQYVNFGNPNAVSTSTAAWNATLPTTTNFSLGTFTQVNQSGTDYVAYVFAHNPNAGIFCGTYTGTGVSGNKITTGFPVKTFITKSQGSTDWFIADKDLTTSNHIDLDSTAQIAAGGPQSFDSDGITLNSDLGSNQSGQQYWFIAIADPALF